ncbi:ABC transporter permease [Paraburkholderia caballeronis]|uniref:Peptide/nickel transport system permease protein n=1 Tax=Paraburkholderia caballeronis TaxID=416943 RepID=A0A1H7P9L7_9BURK|nr:ABC transporter permease [Paraburkholderia caballeronis]PXW25323.1 peptide/nickel transport system permease protein [Paraburkholderia caballeronis]PXX00930.1 peptide/nickel transport system permease protein [Paraburkholderia caballeronis]RAJ99717.1 peptide/nickel transport system permease protein [Paraburkholderia caballeronis]TDV03530.1 peptide/nickel transport system permease protein [Paraburkholderia caballeronis]TDV08421.1 peptide/nickel transport system permease protein [Paraburkholder
MLRVFANRLLVAVPTLILVSMLIFGLQKLLPGDPVLAMAGEEQDAQVIATLRAKYHLDEPVPVQYLLWVRDVAHGDLGASLRTDVPVTTLIAQKLPVTLQLAVMAMVFALGIGIPAGIVSAAHRGSALDYGANVLALSGMSIPNFWLGIMLIFIVSVRWHLLPSSGYVPPTDDLWLSIKTMLMPAFVLGAALGAQLMRHTRSAMLSVLRADYIRTARAKGLLRGTVIVRHAFRNALIPIVTVLALLFGELLAGAVLTEQVFTIPGFGKLVVDAVFNRDYAVVQGVVLVTALSFIVVNLAADVLYILLNPRLRRS